VRLAYIKFASWLRANYPFPIRVPTYLGAGRRHTTTSGQSAHASFFAPWDLDVEPYIRIATGDYPDDETANGRDDALASYLCSLAHEVIHYQQWIRGEEPTEAGVDEEAAAMVDRYALTVDRP
jgi:hypothetical protein